MKIIWIYLKPFRRWLWLAMGLAAVAQVLQLFDPIIFGRIIDQFAVNRGGRGQAELVRGALKWLAIAVGVGAAGRIAQALTDYVTRLVVQKFGMAIFNEGLRQTLRLPYHEFEETSSGQVLSMLQKVKSDNEKFISSFVGVLFSSLVGVAFLVWYAVTKHWALVPVFLVGVVVLGGMTGLLSRKIKTIQRAVVHETNKMSGAITESLRNIELVKSLGLTYPEIRRLKGFTQRIFDLEMQKVRRVRSLAFMQGAALTAAEGIHPVHPAVADLPQPALPRRADLHAVHLHAHHFPAAGPGEHHPGLPRGAGVAAIVRRAHAQEARIPPGGARGDRGHRPPALRAGQLPLQVGQAGRDQRPVVRGALRRDRGLRRTVGVGEIDAGQAAGGLVRPHPRRDLL